MNNDKIFIILFITLIIIYFLYKNKKYNPSPLIIRLKYKLGLINSKFLKYDIRESSDSSYTENKNTIYLCTRDPKTGIYYSDNVLIYVLLHECAHMLSLNYGHNAEFKKILASLVIKAEKLNLYDSNQPFPKTYCGLKHY